MIVGDADQINLSIDEGETLVQKPRAPGGAEIFVDSGKRGAAPVIMIAGHTEQRFLDAGQDFEGFLKILSVLDEVAREADEIRRQRVDMADDGFQIIAIALVVNVGEMNTAAANFRAVQFYVPGFQPGRLKELGIAHRQKRGR